MKPSQVQEKHTTSIGFLDATEGMILDMSQNRCLSALAGLAVAMGALAASGVAHAQCTEGSTFVESNVVSFSVGTSWNYSIYRSQCEGLVLKGLAYQAKGDSSRIVANSISIAQVHVPYLAGTPRYFDVTLDTAGLGEKAEALSPAECSGGTLLDGNRICRKTEQNGYAWKYKASFRRRETLEIFMASQLGQYTYITKYELHDDGTIEVNVGLTGKLQEFRTGTAWLPYGERMDSNPANPAVGLHHWHNIYYRIDMDVDGSSNDQVKKIEYATFNTDSPGDDQCNEQPNRCGRVNYSLIGTEAAQTWSSTGNTTWVVYDKVSLNADGRQRGYELSPHITGLNRGPTSTSEPWSGSELWVTKYNGCELLATHNTTPYIPSFCGTTQKQSVSAMVNGESVDGQDVVLWYRNSTLHVVREEDGGSAFGTATMPIEWTGFELKPRSFHHTNPAE